MGKEAIRAGRHLRRGARLHLSDIPNVSQALTEIDVNPGEYNLRIREFDIAIAAFNLLVDAESNPGEEYLNLLRVRRTVDGYPLPTFQSALRSLLRDGDRHIFSAAAETFADINTKTETGEWKFPSEVTDPNRLTSALLIEGYGLFLERLYNKPGLARSFVLGFEEVLWNRLRGSKILKDVLPWMIEEHNAFSHKMSKELK